MEQLILSRKEVGEKLKKSLPIVDELLRRKEHPIPSFRIGRSVCISASALQEWIKEETARCMGNEAC